MKKETIVSIEMTATQMKLVRAGRVKNDFLVTTSAVVSIKERSDEEISQILLKTVREAKIQADQSIAVIARRYATLVQLRLPVQADQEVRNMVSLQIVNCVPYAREDIVYDYRILEKESSGYSRVLVAVVSREVVNRYLKILARAGIAPGVLTLSSTGLTHWYLYQKNKAKISSAVSMLIHMDADQSELCFYDRECLLFSREINFGLQDMNPEGVDLSLRQIDLTMASYVREKMGPEILQIFIVTPFK